MSADYTPQTMAGQVRRWLDAADAYRRRDAEQIATLLADPDLPDRRAYPYTITLTVLGACLCAEQLARLNQHPLGAIPAGYSYVLETLRPQEEPTASQRVAAQAITTAANGDYAAVGQQIGAYATPDLRGAERITDVIMELLSTYVALTAAGQP